MSNDIFVVPEIDLDIEEITSPVQQLNTAIIRTSDRNNFRRCRRRWAWQSHLRGSLTPVESAAPLWFGSGFHFALEDYHGYRRFQTPSQAFLAYVKASLRQSKSSKDHRILPYNWQELVDLGVALLDYYSDEWLIGRDPLQTLVIDGVPQVEVHIQIKVPFKNQYYDKVFYAATFDRVVIDEQERIFIVDYKTAKTIQTHFFQNDPQISAYCWLGNLLYGRPISGFIYQQHLKTIPNALQPLSTGKISTAKTLSTSHRQYRKSLINLYGSVDKAPVENIDFLNYLCSNEDETKDKFIRRDRIYRNQSQAEAEGAKLLMELEDMLNLDLPLYPSPSRDCIHMCAFHAACVNIDDGSDWEGELQLGFRPKEPNLDSWRKFLIYPGE